MISYEDLDDQWMELRVRLLQRAFELAKVRKDMQDEGVNSKGAVIKINEILHILDIMDNIKDV